MTSRIESYNSTPLIAIALLYFLPIGGWIFFTYLSTPLPFSWPITLVGVLLLALGTALFITLFRSYEQETIGVTPPLPMIQPLEMAKAEIPLVSNEAPLLHSEIEKLQKALLSESQKTKELEKQLSSSFEEHQRIRNALEELQIEKAERIDDTRSKIETLQMESHQKQQVIDQLENQISDLRYEIKTLLQLTEINHTTLATKSYSKSPTQEFEKTFPLEEIALEGVVNSEEKAQKLLKRCTQIVQKISTGYRASTLRSFSANPYALDLRRLVDALKGESGALIIAYAQKDRKIIFASKESKEYLGHIPENLMQDFEEILDEKISIWDHAVEQLLTKQECKVELPFKGKNQELISLHGVMGSISTGVFRSLVLAIFYLPTND